MDAYVFATEATQTAVAGLGAGVGTTGPARVVLPVIGSHALFVAVAASTGSDLHDAIAGVVATTGVSGCSAFLASTLGITFLLPVHASVDAFLGFALLDTLPGLSVSVHDAATAITGVTGVAVVTGSGYSVLVEVTGPDSDAVAALLSTVTALSGVRAAATAIGSTDLGFGLTSI